MLSDGHAPLACFLNLASILSALLLSLLAALFDALDVLRRNQTLASSPHYTPEKVPDVRSLLEASCESALLQRSKLHRLGLSLRPDSGVIDQETKSDYITCEHGGGWLWTQPFRDKM